MTTMNGKNKLQRLINKLQKYLNLNLTEHTNKYLKVKKENYKNDIFVVPTNITKLSKNNEWLIIKPTNFKLDKPIIIKSFNAFRVNNWFINDITIFKLNFDFINDEVKQALKDCLLGSDDIFTINDFLKNKEIYIEKNASFY